MLRINWRSIIQLTLLTSNHSSFTMYNSFASTFKTMGDVDVLWHDGIYHLFHLVLPNHDFIAHAISKDGLNWKRIQNAIFISDPGSWDDYMLWTMHVSPDPHEAGWWRMFYTGISLKDEGKIQRIGLARSCDLIEWHKIPDKKFHLPENMNCKPFQPLCSTSPYYESEPAHDHAWVSFRDPYYFRDNDEGYLLTASRVPYGPTIRRGCVGIAKESTPNEFEVLPPLHHPGQYDDIEVPNIIKFGQRYYLIGSIREDAKIRYWYADDLKGPWNNYYENVLLAGGNYAGRVSYDDQGPLLWNFYTADSSIRNRKNLMPPPKRIVQRPDGRLAMQTIEAFDDIVEARLKPPQLNPIALLYHHENSSVTYHPEVQDYELRSNAGFQGFLFSPVFDCFRFKTKIRLSGEGKCGFLFRIDPESSDGYYLSLDLLKGVAQLRAWGHRNENGSQEAFAYRLLQAAYWRNTDAMDFEISLLVVNNYIEFSLDHHVLLSLADESFSCGHLGAYVESAGLILHHPTVERIQTLAHPTDDLPIGPKHATAPVPTPNDPTSSE